MKKLLLSVLLSWPLLVRSQKIALVETDKFTNEKRVLTDELLVLNTKSKWPHLYIQFRAVDTTCFLYLHGEGIGGGVINSNDVALILLNDNSTITVFSTGLQSYDVTYGGLTKEYRHQYKISLKDVQALTEKKIVSIRRYCNSSYVDIDIIDSKTNKKREIERGEKHSDEAQELANKFYQEVIKS